MLFEFNKELIITALKKMADEDLDKVAFEEPFSNIYLYTEHAIEDEKKAKALKFKLEDEVFYIL